MRINANWEWIKAVLTAKSIFFVQTSKTTQFAAFQSLLWIKLYSWSMKRRASEVCTHTTNHSCRSWMGEAKHRVQGKTRSCWNKHLQLFSVLYFARRLTPRCVLALCESFTRFKTKNTLWKVQKVAKKVPKMYTAISCLLMERFSISRRNSITKMSTYTPKVVTRPKTKSQKSSEASSPPPPLVMVWWEGSYSCETYNHFCNADINMNCEVFLAMVNYVLPPLEEAVFTDEDEWYFQQNSAPICKTRKMQKCVSLRGKSWSAYAAKLIAFTLKKNVCQLYFSLQKLWNEKQYASYAAPKIMSYYSWG